MSSDKRMLIIGLDSGTWKILDPLMAKGFMPHVKELVRRGAWGVLESTVPPVTAPAWSSFLTGVNPAAHGLFNFWLHDPKTYQARYVDASWLANAALWDYLNDAGLAVGLVGVPMTYPVKPLDGFMISGILTPKSAEDFCYPSSLKNRIRARWPNYVFAVEWFHYKHNLLKLVDLLIDWVEKQLEVCLYLMREEPSDVFATVFSQVDAIQHATMRYIDEGIVRNGLEDNILVQKIEEFYKRLDGAIGRLVEEAGTDIPLMMLSDHGSARYDKCVYLDEILLEGGFLKYHPVPAYRRSVQALKDVLKKLDLLHLHERMTTHRSLIRKLNRRRTSAIDFSRSKAFTSGTYGGSYPGIYINLRGRERDGIVEHGHAYESVRESIIGLLRGCTDDDGTKLFETVFKREEIYSGEFMDRAPDIIPVAAEGYFAYGKRSPRSKVVDGLEPGMGGGSHAPDGMLLACGPGIESSEFTGRATLSDLLPTMLYWLGVRVPAGLDGRVLEELFTPAFLADRELRYSGLDAKSKTEMPRGHRADQDTLRDRLKGLGYLD